MVIQKKRGGVFFVLSTVRVWTPCNSDKTTRPTPIVYGYNMGCTHINYKRESFVAYYPTTDENCPDFHIRVISLKRFRLFSQKVVSFALVRAACARH